MAVFVNPYTFVPNVTVPERRAPAGHAAMQRDRFSGVLDVTVTARTPLLIGGYGGDGASAVGRLPMRQDGTVMIPGSGLMGAVRSLHEALTGSCLRIVDAGYVPVHRHPVNKDDSRDLTLAVVDEVDSDGRALSVRVCDDWVKIPKALLLGPGRSDDDLPRAGDQLKLAFSERQKGKALRVRDGYEPGAFRMRKTRIGPLGPVTGDCWVLLVTDTSARSVPGPVQFAAGHTGPGARRYGISDAVWSSYLAALEGADDLRPAAQPAKDTAGEEKPRPGPSSPEFTDVWWPPPKNSDGDSAAGQEPPKQKIGYRLRARPYLHVGQPVWVRAEGGQATEIRLSLFWRYPGAKTVGDRLGQAGPCTDPARLCWSCRMFGSANTDGREADDVAVQHSYRGHIRIDDLLAPGPVTPVSWKLAPLASPKPSAGQFYLDNSAVPDRDRVAEPGKKAAATWGAGADGPRPRPLRGRKFYWRTETDAVPDATEPSRGRWRAHQSDPMSGAVSLIPAGTTFTGRVAFDNLDAAEYGSLLAALDPRLLGAAEEGWEESVSSVGGGKPFGFGSVTIDVTRVWLESAAQRYLGEPGPEPPADEAAVRAFAQAVGPATRVSWPALRHALQFGFVEDAKVWYPPGDGQRGDKAYDESFEFFARTKGQDLADGRRRDLIVLPDAARPASAQELDSAAGERRRGR